MAGLILQDPLKGSKQEARWSLELFIRTIALLNNTSSNHSLLLNLDLTTHLNLRLLPNSPGLDFMVSSPFLGMSLFWGALPLGARGLNVYRSESVPTQYVPLTLHSK
jgi:hypothetical protein